jgi:hypothetical protein
MASISYFFTQYGKKLSLKRLVRDLNSPGTDSLFILWNFACVSQIVLVNGGALASVKGQIVYL